MKITFNEVKSIADTLPIALYAKRRIPVALDSEADASCWSPITDKIVISYKQIECALHNTPDAEDKEVAIRSMLYHEVSHAILTGYNGVITRQFNIFEDERIETILNDFYLDVNFANQVYRINGINSNDDLSDPKDAYDAFYQLVRFHKGDADLLAEVERIIKKYADLTREKVYGKNGNFLDYAWEIDNLFEKVKNRFNFPDNNESNDSDNNQSDGSNSGSSNANGNSTNEAKENGNKKTPIDVSDVIGKIASSNDNKKAGNTSSSIIGDGKQNSLAKIFSNAVAPTYDSDMYKRLEMIISNFNKKNNSGSSMNGYSGVFNPRNAVRTDYKYFDRMASVNGTNKFGTFHLNLFLDNSGSFSCNMNIVNNMLGALLRLEKVNRNFTFNVVHCGWGEKLITNPDEYGLTCDDGTSLDYDAIELYKKLQKPNTYNYNIVLYDGSCYNWQYEDAFKAFNHNNCTIISDPENRTQIETYAPNAKSIITTDYTENLTNNVITAIGRAFR